MSLLRRMRRDPSLLVLVKTCEAHQHYLERFQASEIGELLRRRPRTRVLTLHADPALDRARLDGDRLTVPTEESYESLCSKLQHAYEWASAELRFDSLLRLDVTVVMNAEEMARGKFGGRPPIDLAALAAHLRDADYRRHYGGFMLHERPDRAGIENWARVKGLTIDYDAIYGDGPVLPFYSGKSTYTSRQFVHYVAQHGRPLVQQHDRYLPGSDDLILGVLYERFRLATGAPPLVPPSEHATSP